jgi:cellulose synthase/poly-beta-1,6-N-acetylglucosamine synthase-like glycosyltransferase
VIYLISVIIPAYNSGETIHKTIEALQRQNYPKRDYEIIVVDDGSTDKTEEIVKKFKNVKFFKQKHKGPAYARNLGSKFAKGNILLFTDADCIPDKNWIKNMIKPFGDKKVVAVSGTYKTLNKNNLLARFIGYDIQFRHEYMKKKEIIDFVGTFSAAYKKSIFQKENGFDTSFPMASGEDPELSYRIAKKHKIIFQPSAFVWHPHPESLMYFLKQKFWRVYWRYLMYNKHKDKILGDSYTPITSLISMGVQVISVGLIFLFALLSFFVMIPIYFLILFLFLVIIIPNIKFSFWVWKSDRAVAFIAPIIFFLRNIAFTLGTIVGGINYLMRKL